MFFIFYFLFYRTTWGFLFPFLNDAQSSEGKYIKKKWDVWKMTVVLDLSLFREITELKKVRKKSDLTADFSTPRLAEQDSPYPYTSLLNNIVDQEEQNILEILYLIAVILKLLKIEISILSLQK